MTFYNTVGEKGEDLKNAWQKCNSQEQIAVQMLKKYKKLTASRIMHLWPDKTGVPLLTSVRRVLSGLFNNGIIIKKGKVKGLYNRLETVWGSK